MLDGVGSGCIQCSSGRFVGSGSSRGQVPGASAHIGRLNCCGKAFMRPPPGRNCCAQVGCAAEERMGELESTGRKLDQQPALTQQINVLVRLVGSCGCTEL